MSFLSYIKQKSKSTIFKNITILSGGSALAQGLGVLISPIISRLYTPAEFGLVGSLLAFTSIVSLIGSLKYDLAIVLEKEDESSKSLLDLNVVIILLVTFISGILLITSSYWLDYLNDKNDLIRLFPYAIPIVLFSALYNAYNNQLNREKEYKRMVIFQIIRKISTSIPQVLFGLLSASALGLVLGNVLGVVIPITVLFFVKKPFSLYNFSNFDKLKKIAIRYYKFPLYVTPQSFINLLSAQLPIFILGYYFTLEVVGAYFFTLKIVQVPAIFIGLTFRQVFYQEAAQLKSNLLALKELFKKMIALLSVIMITPMFFLFFYGENLFVIIFGNEWALAGAFASWMFLWYGSNVITGPARSLFLVFEKQKSVFVIDLILFLLRLGSLIAISMYSDSIIVVKWFSIISVIFNLFVIIWWFRFFKEKTQNLTLA